MFRVTRYRQKLVPYSQLFTYNKILASVFDADPTRTAVTIESAGSSNHNHQSSTTTTRSYTYGQLQDDVLACAGDYIDLRNVHFSGNAKKSTSRWPSEDSVLTQWMQPSRPLDVHSVFSSQRSDGTRLSCDVLKDEGQYNAALMTSPSYEFVVGLLAIWAVNMMAVPVCHTHHYASEMTYTLGHSRSRLIIGDGAAMRDKLPKGYDSLWTKTSVQTITPNAKQQQRASTTTDPSASSTDTDHHTFEVESVWDITSRLSHLQEQRALHAKEHERQEPLVIEEIIDTTIEEGKKKKKVIESSDDVIERLEAEKELHERTREEREVDEAIRLFREQNAVPSQTAKMNVSEDGYAKKSFDDDALLSAKAISKQCVLHPYFQQRYLAQQTTELSPFVPSVLDDALMIYTSGTTARPKGVVHTHQSVSHQVSVLLDAWRWTSDDVIVNCLPLHHVHGLVNIMLCALAAGARCIFTPFDNPSRIAKRLAFGDVTLFMGVPTLYSKLIKAVEGWNPIEQTGWRNSIKTNVRLMVCGSAALPVPTLDRFWKLSGHILLERYGMTEVGMALSQKYLPLEMRRPGSVGQPLEGMETYLIPAATEETSSEANKAGHDTEKAFFLNLRGPALFDRYWANPKATKETVVSRTNDKKVEYYFESGDTVGVTDVELTLPTTPKKQQQDKTSTTTASFYRILGRTSVDIIKCRGYKLSALEIEAALLSLKDLVQEVAVVGVSHPTLGEEIVAIVQPNTKNGNDEMNDEKVVEGKLREAVKEVLTHYKQPSKYVVLTEGIPRNAMGKVNKKELKKTLKL